MAKIPRKVWKDWNKNIARERFLKSSRKRTREELDIMEAAEAKRERRRQRNV